MLRVRRGWPLILAWSVAFAGVRDASAQAPASPDATQESLPAAAIRWSLKGGALFSQSPDAADPFAGSAATAFGRARIEPTLRFDARTSFDLAYEQRVRVATSRVANPLGGALPSAAPAPFRLTPLDWEIASGRNGAWRQEIDRAAVHIRTSRLTLNAGRQAIGWGRGVLFGAIDLFAPFSPLEADREWRRGVDAVTVDVPLTGRSAIESVAVFGPSLDESAFGARVRGYWGDADLELVGGRRGRDLFGGLASSVAVGGAEVHGELAAFRTPMEPASMEFGQDRTVIKAVGGGSYRTPIGAGLLIDAEYHYSGFGATSAGAVGAALVDPEFVRRYFRGDTQILTRHAVAVLASYEYSPLTSFGATWIQQPVDGSGVVGPTLTLTFGDRLSLVGHGYLSYGPRAGVAGLASEYGGVPRSLFVELRFYR